ncbi:hypothetical protein AVO43_06280 [Microbulbifer sp. ZGT114]|nr:hypothetical protein AVO43_06280 [Microbulbifer sp. ZGT114]
MAQPDWREADWGDVILRVGGSYVSPDDESTPFKYAVLQNWDLYNARWEIDSETSWNLSAVWQPLDHWGVELLYIGSTGFDADLQGFRALPGRNAIPLGDFEVTSSNALINWYPLGAECLGRPYVGIGINYTDYHDVSLNGELSDFLIDSGVATGPGRLSLSYSWGVAAQAGLDFHFAHGSPWLANLSLLYFKSDTDARITFPTEPGFDRLYSDFDYDPWIVNLGIGYRF